MFANNPITTDDIEIAEQIFGPNLGSLKQKLWKKTDLIVNNFINIPNKLIMKHVIYNWSSQLSYKFGRHDFQAH